MSKPVALRTSLIWHDEVMSDVVSERPAEITIGPAAGSTFITPEIGLPAEFAIVRPGNRGYLLTLGERMRGTICVDGVEHDVETFVLSNGEPFRATPIGSRDWGVVELDDTGRYKLFFQFVPLEDHQPFFTKQVLAAGALGYVISILALALVWNMKGNDFAEALFRGAVMSTIALAGAAAIRWLLKQDTESRASLAFSVVLHAALLFTTYQLYQNSSSIQWPGPRDLNASYIVTRIETPPPPKPRPAIAVPTVTAPTVPVAHSMPPKKIYDRPTVQPKAKIVDKLPTLAKQGTRGIDKATDKLIEDLKKGNPLDDMSKMLDKLGPSRGDGETGNGGKGPKTRNGNGGENGNGDGPVGQHKKGDPTLDTGGDRPVVACMGNGCGGATDLAVEPHQDDSDTGPKLRPEDIQRVMQQASSRFRACYQSGLNHNENLAGVLGLKFVISPDGAVTQVSFVEDGVRNSSVGDCVKRNVRLLKFPRSGGANVTYPIAFSH